MHFEWTNEWKTPFNATPSSYLQPCGKLALVGPGKHMASPWLIIWTTLLRSFLEEHSGHSLGGKAVLNCNNASFFNIFQEKITFLYNSFMLMKSIE